MPAKQYNEICVAKMCLSANVRLKWAQNDLVKRLQIGEVIENLSCVLPTEEEPEVTSLLDLGLTGRVDVPFSHHESHHSTYCCFNLVLMELVSNKPYFYGSTLFSHTAQCPQLRPAKVPFILGVCVHECEPSA